MSKSDRKLLSITMNDNLSKAWDLIPAVKNMGLDYKPCLVTLKDGSRVDYVYIVNATDYIKVWGVWPWADKGKRYLEIQDIVKIEESFNRIPVPLAEKLYSAGESGMGYVIFTLVFNDGTRQAYLSGNAIDFIKFPKGKTKEDIIDVLPHTGRNDNQLSNPEYYWCIFKKGEK